MKKAHESVKSNSSNGAAAQSAKPRQTESVKSASTLTLPMADDTMMPRIQRGDTLILGPKTKPHACAAAVVEIQGFPKQLFTCRVEARGGAFTLWHDNPNERFGPRCPSAEFVSFYEVLEVRRRLRPTWADEVETLYQATEQINQAVNRSEGLLYLLGDAHAQGAIDNDAGPIDRATASSLDYFAQDSAALLVKELDGLWNAVNALRSHARDEAAPAMAGTEAVR